MGYIVLRLVLLFFVCSCSTINRIDASGSGRAFPIASENYVIERFRSVNRNLEWDPTNFLVDLSGLYANCKYVGTRSTMKVERLTPDGNSIIGIVDYTDGNHDDVNSVNGYLKKVIDRWITEGRFNNQIRGADRFGCSVRPGCNGEVAVSCLFSPGRDDDDDTEEPPPNIEEEDKPKALAFTPEQYKIAEIVTKNRWDRSHFLENMSGFETDCAMIGNNDWPFTKAESFARQLGTRYIGTYGYAANRGSTQDALERILQKLKRVSSAKQVGCSLIPDCFYDGQMYVVVSCIYEEN